MTELRMFHRNLAPQRALALLPDAHFSRFQITLVITAIAGTALIGVLAGVSLIAPVVLG